VIWACKCERVINGERVEGRHLSATEQSRSVSRQHVARAHAGSRDYGRVRVPAWGNPAGPQILDLQHLPKGREKTRQHSRRAGSTARARCHRAAAVGRAGQYSFRISTDPVVLHGAGDAARPREPQCHPVRFFQANLMRGRPDAGQHHLLRTEAVNCQPPRSNQKAEAAGAVKKLRHLLCACASLRTVDVIVRSFQPPAAPPARIRFKRQLRNHLLSFASALAPCCLKKSKQHSQKGSFP
jgi:hypothetical protein